MSNGIKKIFENAVWWSGVIMIGLILGISLQVVKAWTEPTVAPPGGNVGAPINTGTLTQIKNGFLEVTGLVTSSINIPGVAPVAGNVLIAQNASGQVAWAAGGASFTYYCNNSGSNVCTDSGGVRGYCPAGFRQIYELGTWGSCISGYVYLGYYPGHPASASPFRPPGGDCPSYAEVSTIGKAFVCSQ